MVLDTAMAMDVSSSANTIAPGVVTCVTQANAATASRRGKSARISERQEHMAEGGAGKIAE